MFALFAVLDIYISRKSLTMDHTSLQKHITVTSKLMKRIRYQSAAREITNFSSESFQNATLVSQLLDANTTSYMSLNFNVTLWELSTIFTAAVEKGTERDHWTCHCFDVKPGDMNHENYDSNKNAVKRAFEGTRYIKAQIFLK